MKSKKLLSPVIVLVVAIVAMIAYSLISNIAKKPTITENEFAFSVTYELNGETETIDDVITVRYDRNDGYTDTKTRIYIGKIGGIEEENVTTYHLQEDADGYILLNTKLYADYLMGDTPYDYFADDEFAPQILYYDSEHAEYTDEETLAAQGVRLVSWEYPTPIKNSFVFSHISICNNQVVVPVLLIAILALLAMMIFVKKDADFVRKPIDVLSVIFDFLIAFTTIPVFTVAAWLMDIAGDNEHIFCQMFYFIPALTGLCIAASVGLRRKGFKKSALIVPFIGPAVFVLILFLNSLGLF